MPLCAWSGTTWLSVFGAVFAVAALWISILVWRETSEAAERSERRERLKSLHDLLDSLQGQRAAYEREEEEPRWKPRQQWLRTLIAVIGLPDDRLSKVVDLSHTDHDTDKKTMDKLFEEVEQQVMEV